MSKPKIIIANINNRSVNAEFAQSLVKLATNVSNGDKPYQGMIFAESNVNISKSRNETIQMFLESDGEWLLMLDSDVVFPPDIVERLLASAVRADCKIIGGLIVVVGDVGPHPTLYHLHNGAGAFLKAQSHYPENTILQVSATGGACLMVHREVFEAIRQMNLDNRKWLEGLLAIEDETLTEIRRRGLLNAPTEKWCWFQEHPVVRRVLFEGAAVKAVGTDHIDEEYWVGEDIDFCLTAQMAGYDTFVDCSLEIGHRKDNRTWWPKDIKEGFGFVRPDIVCVIPVKDRLDLTQAIVQQIREQGRCSELIICDNGSQQDTKEWLAQVSDVNVLDCAGMGIHEMWNKAIEEGFKHHPERTHFAFLNNDLILGDRFLDKLSLALFRNQEYLAVCGNYDERTHPEEIQEVHEICANRYDGTGGLAGFAFMVRGEWFTTGYKFPEECKWWYGDNDLMNSILLANSVTKDIPRKAGIVLNARVQHIDGGGGTSGDVMWSEFGEQLEKDRLAYEKRWNEIRLEVMAREARSPQTKHECRPEALAHLEPYVDEIQPDRLPFIADLEASVGVFTQPWEPVFDMIKVVEDVERYSKIIAETQPEVIVECGTSSGGSAEWFLNQGMDVITIDVGDFVPKDRKERCGNGVRWAIGSSVDADVVEQVEEFVGNLRCMVALDSSHHACHVLAEMHLYSRFVTPGCYLVVEDGIHRWLFGDERRQTMLHHGPMDSIEMFLPKHLEFVRDEDIERMHPITLSPAGWLRKVG